MLRLATDADFNGRVLRGLLARQPDLDIVRVQDAGLRTAHDPEILEWAAREGRIVITHDRQTMPGHAYERVETGLPMPGVFVVPNIPAVGRIIEAILLTNECSTQDEWRDRVEFLPL
jgi:hypothetical protein